MKHMLYLLAILVPVFGSSQSIAVLGVSSICELGSASYQVSGNAAGATAIIWSCTDPDARINDSPSPLTVPLTGNPFVTVTFGIKTTQVCAQIVGGANSGSNGCKTVTVSKKPPTILPLKVVYSSQLPYIWDMDWMQTANQIGAFSFSTSLTSYQGCDSVILQYVIVKRDQANIRAFIDSNGNGVYDPDESPVFGSILVYSGSQFKFSQSGFGDFEVSGLLDQDKMYFQPDNQATAVAPAFRVFNSQSEDFYEFAVSPNGNNTPDWGVNLDNLQIFRAGFPTEISMSCFNNNNPAPTTAKLVLSP